ncbi:MULTISPECIES: beta-ketoacyl-ACP synthase II [Brevibacillus]|jgi:3-oxoacyl-[acyl-carrier-protein] synthase II|uniref:beta-ketoacyl-ACP synthase II n=1 Tax=Brevibacillus TaxID=55080 RepID=UPI0004F29533|nr:beta-ketoacyl-ACP synthase II [Brevibacillus borstelensis]KKX56608.1 3-oxoacyl-ACP synthase [Brevibacillus borstelensis cifa_chp40]MBE5397461.1 beta-ketoacyl-ACP synthase II [Brevibacillus borstelensis]MCC0562884.1 beta-ketoacyl-ACP synthase II [Brevibacillus borstelensis]MCM3470333.1 beta-ketoacyl-ACP synthase II [Brevibacillus borstelensis]MCM3557152.1 beta-ketoacyl-ACP synthase II [Brevibacillus borstelensis]
MERVVITGMGVISPLGNDVQSFWSKLIRGESGITRIDTFDTDGHKAKIAGLVRDFDAEARFGRKEARRMDRFCQFALAAAEQAFADAALDPEKVDRERMGVYVGSGIGGIQTLLEQEALLQERGPGRVSPTLVPMMIANMAAAMISIRFGAHGPTMAPVTACSIGNTAIGEAFRLIRAGGSDVVLAGGTEAAITDISLASFGNATAISTRNDEPAKASRPFDLERDGFVMAEGAGIVVLESLTHALKRNARIYAEVIGYGASSDAYHMVATHPEGIGAYLAMKAALKEAGIEPQEVDLISAHATSTEIGDKTETAAIKRLFGEAAYKIPVTANKSMIGHMLGAAGGVEAIALVKSLGEGVIPPTINLENPDPACDLDYVPNRARRADLSIGISNSFGFGGHNAVIALKNFAE